MNETAKAPGSLIGGMYHVVRTLGEGAMGVVLLAHDPTLERSVAIKLIRPELLDSPDLRERFHTEARAMARVNHPNVLQIYAFGEHEGAPYFVMELVEGETVEELQRRAQAAHGSLDVETAMRILDDTCQGVTAIHGASTVHRDLKPSNLLMDATGRVRVADLGVASILQRTTGEPDAIVGTPAYMAPEVVLQTELSPLLMHRADIYSLGCLAYELLTGVPPFSAPSLVSLMMRHAAEQPMAPSQRRPDLSPALDDVILRALVKDPAERTPSAEAFRRELAAAYAGGREPVRILVAEDDPDFRDALAITLGFEFPDAHIECCPDGVEALAAYDKNPFSVAIIDLGMPRLDGIELTGLLRARETAETMPIIVLTAFGGPGEWKRLAAMGADGFLVKPVRLPDVVSLVRRALKERTSLPPQSRPPGGGGGGGSHSGTPGSSVP